MAVNKKKIIRATTVPVSLTSFCSGLLKDLSEQYEVIALSSPGIELAQIHQTDGVRTISVPMERHISIKKDIVALFRMIRVFRQEKPYMVHSMTPKAGLLCMVAAWITRVPRRVHTFTGLVWPSATGLSRRLLMFTDRVTCACATHIIPEGRGVMEDLQHYITQKPMRVLGYGNVCGVDMNFWSRENADQEKVCQIKGSGQFTFLFVGRIVKDKGINELVEAFLRLYEKNVNIRLILVGWFEEGLDPLSDETRRQINECGDIVCVGPQYGKDLLAYYAASDCFVFPSYREGFPNTVLEAGAMGLPSIVTDINGSREIIEDGKNGFIVPSKNVDELMSKMRCLLEDDELCDYMSAEARPMIVSRFEQGFVRKCLMDFYDEIIP